MEEEINLLEYYYILKKKFWFLFLFILFFNLAVIGALFIWPKTYTCEAILLPVSAEKSSPLSSLAMLSGMSGLDQTSKTTNQLIIFLESRSLAQRVIEHGDFSRRLMEVQKIKQGKEPPRLEDLASLLSGVMVKVETNAKKGGAIQFSISSPDPYFSYDLIYAYLRELQSFIQDNHITTAKRNREFIGEQLLGVQKDLLEAGKTLSNYYVQYKIPAASSKVDVTISLPLLGGNGLSAKGTLDFSMDQRKDLVDALMKQNEEIKKEVNQITVKDVPQQNYLEYLTIQKTLLSKLQVLLAEQYEMARLDEAKESLTFQIVDGPVFTMGASKPNKKMILAAAFVASIVGAVFIVFIMHYIKMAKEGFSIKKQTTI